MHRRRRSYCSPRWHLRCSMCRLDMPCTTSSRPCRRGSMSRLDTRCTRQHQHRTTYLRRS
jgi:hypothetical protein